jgi:integrase
MTKKAQVYYYKPRNKFSVVFYEKDKRKVKYFNTKLDAKKYADDFNRKLILKESLEVSSTDMAYLKDLLWKMDIAGLSWISVFSLIDKEIDKKTNLLALQQISPKDAIKIYEKINIEKGLRANTIDGYTKILKKTLLKFETVNISLTDAENILKESNMPKGVKTTLRAFYNVAIKQKWTNKNWFKKIELKKVIKDKTMPAVLSLDKVKVFLYSLKPEWRATFALMAFAGIRPMEINDADSCKAIERGILSIKDRMRVKDINFIDKKITIRAECSKSRKDRILENLPENLWKWLEPLKYKNPEGYVMEKSYSTYKRTIAKLGADKIKDIFRHTFASNAYHYLGLEHTIEILGHSTECKVFHKHYKGVSNKQIASEYFSIIPQEAV